jgi:hypothetical protein
MNFAGLALGEVEEACAEAGELRASLADRRDGFAHARQATFGVFRHRLASGAPQGPTLRALAAGPVEGVDLRPQLLQRCQAGGTLGLMRT